MNCPRCTTGQMGYTGSEIATGLYEHRCTNCGYVEHFRGKRVVLLEPEATADPVEPEPLPVDNAAILRELEKQTKLLSRIAKALTDKGIAS